MKLESVRRRYALRDIGDKLYAGRYRTPDELDSDLRRVFQNCRDYNPEGSVVREFGDALSRVMEQWVADYNACAELVGETLLCADARLLCRFARRHRLRAVPPARLPRLYAGPPGPLRCETLRGDRRFLHVCAFLPTAGLAGMCAAARRSSDLRRAGLGRGAGRGAFSGPPPPPLLAPARPGKASCARVAVRGGRRQRRERPPPAQARVLRRPPSVASSPAVASASFLSSFLLLLLLGAPSSSSCPRTPSPPRCLPCPEVRAGPHGGEPDATIAMDPSC